MPFAQVKNTGAPDAAFAGFLAVFLGIMCFVVIVAIIIQVFFILTCKKCIEKIAPRNRAIEPGACWLQLIPLFNLYYTFVLTAKVSESVQNEYEDRRLRPDGDFGKQIGMWWGICNIASLVPYVGSITGIAGLVLFIIFWIKVAGYSKTLDDYADDDADEDRPRNGREEESDDDRPRRKRKFDEGDDDGDDDRPRRKRRDHDDLDR